VVLLTGFVSSEATKTRCGEIASGVSNVKNVVNGIYVLD
jgi:osmotically-inducible protein OsmY